MLRIDEDESVGTLALRAPDSHNATDPESKKKKEQWTASDL
jgi:hypothetical protein